MIVAWDARKLRDGGIGTYIRGCLAAAAEQAPQHQFVALIDPADRGWAPGSANLREVEVVAGKYGIAEHLVVPRAARRARADLLHAPHYTLPLGWNRAAVVTIHDLTHIRFARFFPPGTALYARTVAGAAARRARVVLADSTHTRDDVVSYLGVPERKVRVVPLGVAAGLRRPSPDRVSRFARERSLPSDYLLYVGARKRSKNLETLLDAVARLPRPSRPPLVLSGPPWPRDAALARRAAALGIEADLRFAGDLADDETLACLYAGAALYLQPSLAEGFGLPPLEAMACGVAVISSDAGSLPETVGDAALLLTPLDAAGWSHAIESILSDTERRQDLVRRGLARAAGFTWRRTAELTLAAYEAATDG